MNRLLQIALGAGLLVAIGLVGGHLAIFADTTAYVRQGEYWASRLHLAAPLAPPPIGADWTSLMPATVAGHPGPLLVAAARSPIYGLFLYLGAALGTLTLVVALQALAVSWLLRLTARLASPESEDRAFWSLVSVLALGSGLPFFVDFAMPDVFGGLAILMAVILLVAADLLGSIERVAIWCLMLFSLLVHAANPPVVLLLVTFGGVWLLTTGIDRSAMAWRVSLLLVAVGLSLIGPRLIQEAYRHDTGYAQGSPPFLVARLLEDGPGRAYLDAACPGGASPTLCGLRDRPMHDANAILWATGSDGLVAASDPAIRRQIKVDEMAFVLAVLRFDPLHEARAALGNAAGQLLAVKVDDPLADPGRYRVRPTADVPAMDHLIPGLKPCEQTGGCQSLPTLRMVDLLFAIHGPVLLLSLAVIAWLASAGRAYVPDVRLRNGAVLVLAALVINAAVCGILSGVFARYQARIVWLLPMMAVLGLLAALDARRRVQHPVAPQATEPAASSI